MNKFEWIASLPKVNKTLVPQENKIRPINHIESVQVKTDHRVMDHLYETMNRIEVFNKKLRNDDSQPLLFTLLVDNVSAAVTDLWDFLALNDGESHKHVVQKKFLNLDYSLSWAEKCVKQNHIKKELRETWKKIESDCRHIREEQDRMLYAA